MDPLLQYPDHAFIPYLPHSSPTSPVSPSSSTSSTSSVPPTSLAPADLPPITLHNTSTWTYCGPILIPTLFSLPPSFHTWCASTISGPLLPRLLPLLTFLYTFLHTAGVAHYWLTIRATKPTDEFDNVRWHTDDLFFDYEGEAPRAEKSQQGKRREKRKKPGYWKLATTLLGPGTLFLRDGERARRTQRAAKEAECRKKGEHICSSIRCLNCLDAVEAVRQTLAKSFEDQEVEIPKYGEVAFFRLGDAEGAIHSEPPCHEDRIFINVVPGSEPELRGLLARWGMEYPRSWSFGVPISFTGDDEVAFPPSLRVVRAMNVGEKKSEIDDDGEMRRESLSTMSLNLGEEYTEWLGEKGYQFRQIFGLKEKGRSNI